MSICSPVLLRGDEQNIPRDGEGTSEKCNAESYGVNDVSVWLQCSRLDEVREEAGVRNTHRISSALATVFIL